MRRELISLFAVVLITCSIAAQDVVLEKVENGHRVEIYAVNNTLVPQEVTLDLTLQEVAVDKDLPYTEIVPGDARVLMATLTPEPLKEWSYKTRYRYEEHVVEKPALPVATEPEPVSDETQPTNTAPTNFETQERPFEEGPDIDDVEPTAAEHQSDDELPNQQSEEKPVNAAPKVSQRQVTNARDDDGVMGPPLNTDDMPIPAKYYEPPSVQAEVKADDANVFEIPPESVVTIGQPEKVIIYGQPGCPRCTMAREYFEDNNVVFEYFDITTDKAAKDEMTAQLFQSGFEGGQFIMPVIYVDDIAHYSIKDLEGFLDGVASRD